MNGLMQWFKSSNKMKRWIFLILIGIILTCYGLAEILVMKEISFIEVGKVVVIFVMGFVAIIIGLVLLNKRTLEVMIESTDERMDNKNNVNVKSLIFNKKIYDKGPNIVVIGGGTGLNTVLSGLKNYTSNVTAIATISDYGEEITNSRKELELLPLDDLRDSIIALSPNEEEARKLFNYKFTKGKLQDYTFSDIYFSAMKDIEGDFAHSVSKSNEVLNIVGKVLPVTLDEMKIVAELENGYIVEERARIPEVVSEKLTKIQRVLLNPSNCRPAPGVVEAIKEADCIIIGPGSLYTNIIPNLLINGVNKAIRESSAIKVYISNIMTEPGQTDDYSVADHLNAIIDHCGKGLIDYCIYDTGEIIPEFIKKYNCEGQDIVEQNIEKIKGIKFLQRNLSMVKDEFIRHDANLVAEAIIELICDDLKYQDKENDPQYLMLNTKLREEKRINKIKKSMAKKDKKGKRLKSTKKKGKSKFQNKYSDRIQSIKEADKKAEMRRKREEIRKRKEQARQEKKMARRAETKNVADLQNIQKIEELIRPEKTTRVPKKTATRTTTRTTKSTTKTTTKAPRRMKEEVERPISQRPKSARGRRRKTPQEIREEILKKLEE